MKKLILLAAITAFATQLKAQQFEIKPSDTLKKHPFTPNFKLDSPLKLFNPKFNYDYNFELTQPSPVSEFYSRMPVVVLEGNSKMPVVRLDGKSFMPVKRIGSEDIEPIRKNALPGTPTFISPGS